MKVYVLWRCPSYSCQSYRGLSMRKKPEFCLDMCVRLEQVSVLWDVHLRRFYCNRRLKISKSLPELKWWEQIKEKGDDLIIPRSQTLKKTGGTNTSRYQTSSTGYPRSLPHTSEPILRLVSFLCSPTYMAIQKNLNSVLQAQ